MGRDLKVSRGNSGGPSARRRNNEWKIPVARFLSMLLPFGMLLLVSCQCLEDTISWTPLWWLNDRRVQPTGSLHENERVIRTVNYLDSAREYSYRLKNGMVECRIDTGKWKKLPGGNPRNCSGDTLAVKLMAADNNRLFVVAVDKEKSRSLWWYCVVHDQAAWSERIIAVGGDIMRKGYSEWIACAHQGGSWTNLLALREFVPYVEPRFRRHGSSLKVESNNVPRTAIDVDDIVDIAVGNWTGTVVTYYVLMGSTGKIMYIDEEVVMNRWKVVPHLCRPCNDPYPLDSNSRIAASNSVIAAYKRTDNGALFTWIRWDFHNPQDFKYWKVNWCEQRWHSVECPVQRGAFIRFDTHWPDSLRDTIWALPRNMLTNDRTGFMGSINEKTTSNYRVKAQVLWGDSVAVLELDSLDYEHEEELTGAAWHMEKLTDGQ